MDIRGYLTFALLFKSLPPLASYSSYAHWLFGSSRSNLAATTLKDGDQFRGKFSETQASADRQPAFVVPAEQR